MKQARRAALTAATVSTVHAQGTAGFGARLQAVPAMIRDTLSGEYDGLGKAASSRWSWLWPTWCLRSTSCPRPCSPSPGWSTTPPSPSGCWPQP